MMHNVTMQISPAKAVATEAGGDRGNGATYGNSEEGRAQSGETSGGGRWIAALTALVLTVGLVPVAPAEAVEYLPGAKDIIQRSACSVPSSEANTFPEVVEWVGTDWLDGLTGLYETLGNKKPSETLRCTVNMDSFRPAVDGSPSDPLGEDGTMKFSVVYPDVDMMAANKVCTIKAKPWDPLVVEGGEEGTHYDYNRTAGVLTFKKAGSYAVFMTLGVAETNHRIVVAANATLKLMGVNIKTNENAAPPIDVEGHDVTLVLSGENTMTGAQSGSPGIHKGPNGTLTIKGKGSLVAEGGPNAAGIGGATDQDAANIHIEGGTVTAKGNGGGAGIGGGYGGSGSNITMNGGNVTASGGGFGAGIGGGKGGSGSGISVSYGDVTATGGFGASIGGGEGASGSNITVSGGTVTATGGFGAAIGGGGKGGSGSNITVSGGDVTASSGDGAAIGGGTDGGSGSGISVSGGVVNATSNFGAGIGGGHQDGPAENVSIKGGSVTASGYVGIGATGGGTAQIAISGGTVRAVGRGSNFGIGGSDGSAITISGGSVDATMSPTPRCDPDGEGGEPAFDLRRVEYSVAEGTAITHENLTYPAKVPTYYGLTDVVPVDGKLHLWLNEGIELRADGSAANGSFEVTLVPGEGATLAANARLEATELDPTLQQIQMAADGIDALEGAEVQFVPSMDRMDIKDKFVPSTIGGETYRVGDIVDAGSDGKYLILETRTDDDVAVADMETGSRYYMWHDGNEMDFDPDDGRPGSVGVPQEVEKAVSINGVEYLERYACSLVWGEWTIVTHFVYTLEDMPDGGRAAGYYEENWKDGALQFYTGHFNEGRDPQSLKDAGAGGSALSPVAQVVQGGKHFSLYAFGLDIAAPGVQNPGGTLDTRWYYFDDSASPEEGRFANALSVGAHFLGGDVVEHSESSAVQVAGNRTTFTARYDAGSLSPFVTLVAVENNLDIPVKGVGSPPGGDGQKTLAPTGDAAAGTAAPLAALALAAIAAFALARRRMA